MLSNPALLEKVDKLRDLNIGQHVPLPQVKLEKHQYTLTSTLLTRKIACCRRRSELREILFTGKPVWNSVS